MTFNNNSTMLRSISPWAGGSLSCHNRYRPRFSLSYLTDSPVLSPLTSSRIYRGPILARQILLRTTEQNDEEENKIIRNTQQMNKWQVNIKNWQVNIKNWQVNIMIWQDDIKIWQVNIIIWQVMAEICDHNIYIW